MRDENKAGDLQVGNSATILGLQNTWIWRGTDIQTNYASGKRDYEYDDENGGTQEL